MTKDKTFLPIHDDLVFKNLFGVSKNIKNTTNLLEEFFGFDEGFLDGSVITNSSKLDKETITNKSFELDIKLKDPYGNLYNIEMQKYLDKNAEIKNSIYVMGLFQSILPKGSKYKEIKKVTQVEFVKKDLIHKNKDVIKKYNICNVNDLNDKILEDLFNIYIVNIDWDRNKPYNNINGFERWRMFIGAETKEELEIISKGNEILESAMKESLRFMEQDYVQDFSREELLYESRLETAREEGEAKGRLEGEALKQKEIAINMLKNTNLSIEEISKCTGLSIEEVEKIQTENI